MMEMPIEMVVSFAALLLGVGGASAMIKRNINRIDKIEEKQDEDGNLLHEMDGKMDILIDLVKNGIKDKKKELKKDEHSDLGR